MSVFIISRTLKSGEKRFDVRWQQGNGYPQVHMGTFKTKTAASKRREWTENEIAAGRVPDRRRLEAQLASTLAIAARAYAATRIDFEANTKRSLEQSIRLIYDELGSHHPTRITVDDVQAWVISLSERYKPGTLALHLGTLQQVLDHARVTPNPARDPRLRKPKRKRERKWLPTRAELATVYDALPERYVLAVKLAEITGMRISEIVALTWGDIDDARSRVLVADSKTPSGTRWVDGITVALPKPPPGTPTTQRVFDLTAAAVQGALQYHAQRKLGLKITPHTLRHLYASRAINAGVNPVIVAERLGHANPETTWKFYIHRPPPD